MDTLKMLAVVTGTDMYADGNLETGLWLSELTHIYHCAEEKGYEIIIASPKGGNVPVDPESLKPMVLDKLTKGYWDDPEFWTRLPESCLIVSIWRADMVRCMIFLIIPLCRRLLRSITSILK